MSALKIQITEEMKTAMRAKDTLKLGTVRLLLSAMKQREVDERISLSDSDIIAIIEKMLKQRRDSITQYEAAGRTDLAEVEKAESTILQTYLPQALTEEEIDALIHAAFTEVGLSGMPAMGKVMAILKPQIIGRADASVVSAKVKQRALA